jgi:hypothetical protein
MISSRRAVPLLGLAFFVIFLYIVTSLSRQWRRTPEAVGMGKLVPSPSPIPSGLLNISLVESRPSRTPYAPRPQYVPGVPKPDGAEYTKMLVVPKTQNEDTNWIAAELPDWQSAIYVVDDPSSPLHPPKNKGHEVMVYLSFIIEHYDKLPDIVAFMHSHQFAWHNEEIFGGDAAEMLRRLNVGRVVREGYMNLRCIWEPGCPDWMHPSNPEDNEQKQEETMLARSWGEIFPDDPIPQVLAQPCCAQFAVSRERILAIPKARFVFYRDWILRTELSDYISGRIWEYLWHVIFTGEHIVCPEVHVCFCDGYGLCFGGKEEYEAYRRLGHEKEELEDELKRWKSRAQTVEIARMRGTLGETSHLNIPEPGKDQSLQEKIYEKEQKINEVLYNAAERGMDPKARALEAGRKWTEGDGY